MVIVDRSVVWKEISSTDCLVWKLMPLLFHLDFCLFICRTTVILMKSMCQILLFFFFKAENSEKDVLRVFFFFFYIFGPGGCVLVHRYVCYRCWCIMGYVCLNGGLWGCLMCRAAYEM